MKDKKGLNPMCKNCTNTKCSGTTCQTWTGCINRTTAGAWIFAGITSQDPEIIATFKNGRRITFTKSIINLLLTDNDCISIEHKSNGNYIYYRNI